MAVDVTRAVLDLRQKMVILMIFSKKSPLDEPLRRATMSAGTAAGGPHATPGLASPAAAPAPLARRPPGASRVDEHEGRQRPGGTARAEGHTLDSWRIGALPVLDRLLRRLRLH